MRLTVFCHVHYLDVWEEISAHLVKTIGQPFRLVITTSLPISTITPPNGPNLLDIRILQTENRGRDIRPFLEALRNEPEFDVGLKIHTKRSTHRLDGNGWRHAIINSLLPDAKTVDIVMKGLASNEPVGLVAPAGTLCSIAPWIGRNRRRINHVLSRLGLESDTLFAQCPYFIAGSMFWFRASAVRKLSASELDNLHAPEKGQTDGTTAHAIERLFAPVAASEGLSTLSMSCYTSSRKLNFGCKIALTIKEVDSDQRFLQPTHPALVFASSYFYPLVLLYKSAPYPVRRKIRSMILAIFRYTS